MRCLYFPPSLKVTDYKRRPKHEFNVLHISNLVNVIMVYSQDRNDTKRNCNLITIVCLESKKIKIGQKASTSIHLEYPKKRVCIAITGFLSV